MGILVAAGYKKKIPPLVMGWRLGALILVCGFIDGFV
jgi:hypothetical protein